MTQPVGHEVPELEFDETVPPRPEEEIADVARSVPDRAGHGGSAAPDLGADDPAPATSARDEA